jgi:hypothetical protein
MGAFGVIKHLLNYSQKHSFMGGTFLFIYCDDSAMTVSSETKKAMLSPANREGHGLNPYERMFRRKFAE